MRKQEAPFFFINIPQIYREGVIYFQNKYFQNILKTANPYVTICTIYYC